jgi:flagellar hook-length control protein FliK
VAGEAVTFNLPAAVDVQVRDDGTPVVGKVMDQVSRPGAETVQPAKEAGTPHLLAAVDMEGRNNRQAAAAVAGDKGNEPGPEGEQPVSALKGGGGEDIPKSGVSGPARVDQPLKPSAGNQEGQHQWQPGREKPAEGGEMPAVARDGGHETTGGWPTPVSSITPKKFPEVVLPHFVSSLRNASADQARVTVIRLKLEPENMGEIKIRLSYSKGELTAHFFTSSGLVKDAVECSLPQLRETLAQHNVSLGEAAAFVGQEQQDQRWANFRGSGYEQREIPSGTEPGDFHGETLNKTYSRENSLDLLI